MIGISGTPGTGKKTIAPLVAELMGLPPPVSLNSLVAGGGPDVDPLHLRRALLSLRPAEGVVFGHLLPHVLKRSEVALVAVLRCEPASLRTRLLARNYPEAKVKENVEAELIGVVLDECVRRFGGRLVREYDTTSSSPENVARAIATDVRPGEAQHLRHAWIDWTLNYDSPNKLRSLLEGTSDPPAST